MGVHEGWVGSNQLDLWEENQHKLILYMYERDITFLLWQITQHYRNIDLAQKLLSPIRKLNNLKSRENNFK